MTAARLEAALRPAGGPSLIAYLTAGHPDRDRFAEALAAVALAADAVELGVPFTDPMADGATIQRSSRQALAAGVTLRGILRDLAARPPLPVPVLLMSYLNPLLAIDAAELPSRLADAGVSGLVVPDLPHEESGPLAEALAARGLALVPMVTPVTPPDRLARLCHDARGFVYAVTVAGTTGGATAEPAALRDYLARVRALSPAPVIAGFGIRSAAQVAALAPPAHGVVVGSALVEALDAGADPAALLRSLRPAATQEVS